MSNLGTSKLQRGHGMFLIGQRNKCQTFAESSTHAALADFVMRCVLVWRFQ